MAAHIFFFAFFFESTFWLFFLFAPGLMLDSRRATWELVRRAKKGRVVVLTTHFMDEVGPLPWLLGNTIGGGKKHMAAQEDLRRGRLCCASSVSFGFRVPVAPSQQSFVQLLPFPSCL